jgi:hypothetical protein
VLFRGLLFTVSLPQSRDGKHQCSNDSEDVSQDADDGFFSLKYKKILTTIIVIIITTIQGWSEEHEGSDDSEDVSDDGFFSLKYKKFPTTIIVINIIITTIQGWRTPVQQ